MAWPLKRSQAQKGQNKYGIGLSSLEWTPPKQTRRAYQVCNGPNNGLRLLISEREESIGPTEA